MPREYAQGLQSGFLAPVLAALAARPSLAAAPTRARSAGGRQRARRMSPSGSRYRRGPATPSGHRAGRQLPLLQLRLAPRARHPQDRQRAERVQVGHDKRRRSLTSTSASPKLLGCRRSRIASTISGARQASVTQWQTWVSVTPFCSTTSVIAFGCPDWGHDQPVKASP
jgi:hypothetical protein